MLRIAIMGAGRMGSLIRATAEAARDGAGGARFQVVAQVGYDPAEAAHAEAADVLLDFSNASCLDAALAYARSARCAVVEGTTGYTEGQMEQLRALGRELPVVWSGNYSVGVAALRHLVAQAARELPGFDVEIVECHHAAKADAPSGTARMLLDEVTAARDGAVRPVYGRSGMCGARDAAEVGVHAVRGGTVAGVHTVMLLGDDEEVTLAHRAASRQIFVNGALEAAQRLAGRPAGFYTFDELMFG